MIFPFGKLYVYINFKWFFLNEREIGKKEKKYMKKDRKD